MVEFHPDFAVEFMALNEQVQDELAAYAELLKAVGPQLRRPYSDTLKGSAHANMKELRFEAADGVWRVAYAFDPDRKAILLVAGDKAGVSQRRFYASLIRKADQRYDAHLGARRKT
ncbi:MAG TPA: type II toxin-antitoxin system RelE/ParE family toxin [Caulobacteraceae bacterium]